MVTQNLWWSWDRKFLNYVKLWKRPEPVMNLTKLPPPPPPSWLLGTVILNVHATDTESAEQDAVLEVYNPELQGRSYYFTPHGGRIRDLPSYSLTSSKGKTETVNKEYRCQIFYPEVAKERTTYLFLWFDPIHGHYYGFHIVVNSEGRKDPFSSLYMYAEKPPSEVFYDFSCQLEEYCLNREPHFWRDCKFFHDIFQGFCYKWPFVYNSKRIPALDQGINSEICEQYNAYIKKIKFSARSMNQSHFVFYLQFFRHQWNEKKGKDLIRDNATIATFFDWLCMLTQWGFVFRVYCELGLHYLMKWILTCYAPSHYWNKNLSLISPDVQPQE